MNPAPHTEDPRQTVALVIPLYNEAEVFPQLFAAVQDFRAAHPSVTEVVFIDDGSRDQTAALVRAATTGQPGYTLLSFSRNFGHQLAVTAGLDCVRADAAVILDADLQDPLDVIPAMMAQWRAGYDVVYGVRQDREGESWFKRTTASLFYRIFQWMTDFDVPVDTGDFRLVSRRVIEAYRTLEERQPFVRGLIAWLGFNQIGVPYHRAPRAAGQTKYPFRKMMRLALNSLAAFSDKPLRLAAQVGFGIAIASALGGAAWVVAAKYIFHTAISGWASLMVLIVFFGGVQLFFLGLVGLYMARVYDEVKARPRYVVQDRWRSDATPDPAPHPSAPSVKP